MSVANLAPRGLFGNKEECTGEKFKKRGRCCTISQASPRTPSSKRFLSRLGASPGCRSWSLADGETEGGETLPNANDYLVAVLSLRSLVSNAVGIVYLGRTHQRSPDFSLPGERLIFKA
jgi:hypothetical protein